MSAQRELQADEVNILSGHGINNINKVYWNLTTADLYEHAILNHEGKIAHRGPLVCTTGKHTGRSPNDKFIVDEPAAENVSWGDVNRPISEENFDKIDARLCEHMAGKPLFVSDVFCGVHPHHRIRVRIITETAWHSLFARNMFIHATPYQLEHFVPDFVIVHSPSFTANPESEGTKSGTFIIQHFGRRRVIIGGTEYAGEIKKSMFSTLNYLLPDAGVMPMHCSANIGKDGDTALFFGLSGTGKTTLSADPNRKLIGDDEHGWAPDGIFNFEGGCYAKVIRLSKSGEPEIWQTTRMFGTILENVVMSPETRRLDLDDASYTENTRASYPLASIPNALAGGVHPHPKNLIMLTCDAFGVMPPIARMTTEQALYHFLSGYTAKVAGTERGLGSEPQATFSTCFGAPFMVRQPSVYADLLRRYIQEHKTTCWLVNTGWTGGPYGQGSRMKLEYTRSLVDAALNGYLATVPTHPDPVFNLPVPDHVPGVPTPILNPRFTWKDKNAYDQKALELTKRFHKNFEQFEGETARAVAGQGPRLK